MHIRVIDVKCISETLTGSKVGDKVGANVGLRVGDCLCLQYEWNRLD